MSAEEDQGGGGGCTIPVCSPPAARLQVRMMSGVASERADTGGGWVGGESEG